MRKLLRAALIALLFSHRPSFAQSPQFPVPGSPVFIDFRQRLEIPPIGNWMLYRDGSFADWLGAKYCGKYLREPINIIVVDGFSQTGEQAVAKIMKACREVGYADELGHSSGYRALIGDALFKQIPNDRHMAFSNRDFILTNNHGRIMGPARYENRFIFVAGFSTEQPSVFEGFHHQFVSFDRARDDFSMKLNTSQEYRFRGMMKLNNAIDTPDVTTADHDGNAVVFESIR